MKKSFFLLPLLYAATVYAQNYSCCMASVNHQNNLLAMNESFASLHLTPEPFTLENPKGSMITFKTPDGKEGHAYFLKSGAPTDRVLFVYHEWWGLNDYIKQEAEKLQAELGEINVYAIDLYDGKVAATVPDAQKLMGDMKEERSKAIIQGAISFVGKKARIASIGWCMGGAWSLQSALLEGKQAVACVMYYGMPESDVKKLKTLHCDVLGIFALQDGFITPAIVKQFEANMQSVGKKVTVHNYDSFHAFANPSNPRYNKEYAADAHAKALAYLKERLF
jgi:carboxymethylenebutenolidase